MTEQVERCPTCGSSDSPRRRWRGWGARGPWTDAAVDPTGHETCPDPWHENVEGVKGGNRGIAVPAAPPGTPPGVAAAVVSREDPASLTLEKQTKDAVPAPPSTPINEVGDRPTMGGKLGWRELDEAKARIAELEQELSDALEFQSRNRGISGFIADDYPDMPTDDWEWYVCRLRDRIEELEAALGEIARIHGKREQQ